MKTKRNFLGKSFIKKMNFPLTKQEMSTEDKCLYIIQKKGKSTPSEIAKILRRSRSTVSEHLHALVKKGRLGFGYSGKNKVFYLKKR